MINSLQEFGDKDKDKFYRFKYSNSYQYKFNCVENNLVDEYFRKYLLTKNKTLPNIKSKVFLTHDIDLVNSGIKQDSFHLFKKKDFIGFFSIIFNYLIGDRHWRNIDQIMKMESEFDLKATFFWIAQNQYDQKYKIENGDYNIQSNYCKETFNTIETNSLFDNALHKSSNINCIDDELKNLPQEVITNRYHYLKFNPEEDYDKLSKSKIEIDSTLGFAENIGFRNSYGLPFQPFDLKTNSKYNFIEVPLNIMDTTYWTYRKENLGNMESELISFLDKHKLNAIITMLWHNDKLSNMKFESILSVFKTVIAYLYENDIKSISPAEIKASFT